ncbi:MAG: carbohydrate kinase family protein [Candidatus Lokiarchaeota archaeon]|nr:carbohydrate kinase family protein [Candidatus Lokiarchaeota archaeon]
MGNTKPRGKALVLGSLAFDYIMDSPENYYEAMSIKHDKKEIQGTFMSVKKVVHFGGTAGNIAYSMALMGGKPIVAGCVGKDFAALGYEEHMKKTGVDLRVDCIDHDSSASCYIFNDVKKNQITVFHGGALNCSEQLDLENIVKKSDNVQIAINAPNNMAAMAKFSRQLVKMGIPAIFDPGQVLNALTPDQFTEILANSQAFISNEHELEGVTKRFGQAARDAIDKLDWVITTRGSSGSTIKVKGKVIELPIAKAKSVVDPTGAGDSFRGALLYGITMGLDVVQSAKLGVVIGSLKVEHAGGQLPSLDAKEFKKRYKDTFGEDAPI